MREMVIDTRSGMVYPIDRPVGDPKNWPPDPVILFTAFDVEMALRGIAVRSNYGPVSDLVVTRDGIATVTGLDGRQFIYELHPARIGDENPYEPLLYVGVWPD